MSLSYKNQFVICNYLVVIRVGVQVSPRLKVEAIHGERFVTRQAAKDQVFEYIEVYYNRKRLHSRLGYLSPETFELRHVA